VKEEEEEERRRRRSPRSHDTKPQGLWKPHDDDGQLAGWQLQSKSWG